MRTKIRPHGVSYPDPDLRSLLKPTSVPPPCGSYIIDTNYIDAPYLRYCIFKITPTLTAAPLYVFGIRTRIKQKKNTLIDHIASYLIIAYLKLFLNVSHRPLMEKLAFLMTAKAILLVCSRYVLSGSSSLIFTTFYLHN